MESSKMRKTCNRRLMMDFLNPGNSSMFISEYDFNVLSSITLSMPSAWTYFPSWVHALSLYPSLSVVVIDSQIGNYYLFEQRLLVIMLQL